jgi:hypothetical protein
MVKLNANSVLVAGVPASRGQPDHIEHEDNLAMTIFRGEAVEEIHTPQNAFVRAHELMHARHSSKRHQDYVYGRVNASVKEIAEDIRLHVHHWP